MPGALLAWGGHRVTHGHEHVLILEVEAGRGVPGVNMWLSGSSGGSNLRVGFGV